MDVTPRMNTERKDYELIVKSPGRINLIGEHTDYNMGYVMPTAIEKNITFKFRKNQKKKIARVYSSDYGAEAIIDLNKIVPSSLEWENYILGVLHEISLLSDMVEGFECSLKSNLPSGSGLSSSAALECGFAFGLNELFNLGLTKLDIIKLSQRAEHNYVGTQCGIMDQFASVMSEMGNVLLLDCRSLDFVQIPIQLHPYKIIMLNTKVSHNLATSEYNTRKRECEEGVAILNQMYPKVNTLREVTPMMLESCKAKMGDTIFKRCSFVIAENKRVLETADALKNNDIHKVGQLLYQAHEGIKNLYKVSCVESDFLVEFSKKNPAVLGARQTGGGFGGCTLNIVHEDEVENFVKDASELYFQEFEIELEAFGVAPSNGTRIIY